MGDPPGKSSQHLLGGRFEPQRQVEPAPKRAVQVRGKIRSANNQPGRVGVFKLLHQSNDYPIKFANIKRASTFLPESVKLVEEQDTGGRLREVEQLAEVDGGLTKIGANDGVKSHHECRNSKLSPDSLRRNALATARRAMKEQLGTRQEASLPKVLAVPPPEYYAL